MSSALRRRSPDWWIFAALLLLAVVVRFATLGLQSFWYDEAYTPVHVFAPSLLTTLRHVVKTENTPPLWYILEWGWSRVFGDGAVSLRFISALAGVATVAVSGVIGQELGGRRVAIVMMALVTTNPLFVWYSQEARAYGLFVLFAAVALLWFVRAEREQTPRTLSYWAVFSALALLTHYFAVFLIAPQAVLLLAAKTSRSRRATYIAAGALALVGLVLVPLIVAQGGHGTQWIGRWLLSSRLQAIGQYYLTGYSGSPLGHGIELLMCLPMLGAAALLVRFSAGERRPVFIYLGIALVAMALPLAMALLGYDYLAPRNLVADWIPFTVALALPLARGRVGWLLAALLAIGWLAVVVDVDASPRLQRGDWSYAASILRGDSDPTLAIVSPELGAAPLEYYLGHLHPAYRRIRVSEIDLVGYPPVRADAARPPVPGFVLFSVSTHHLISVYRFRAATPELVSAAALRRRAITPATEPEVLAP